MKPATRHAAATAAALLGGGAVAFAAFVWSGAYDIGADAPHTTAVWSLLETLRERSIETRAQRLAVPADLGDDARVVRGAGNYDAMCTGCHLAPGMAATELSRGLYPQPPELAKERRCRRPRRSGSSSTASRRRACRPGAPAWPTSMCGTWSPCCRSCRRSTRRRTRRWSSAATGIRTAAARAVPARAHHGSEAAAAADHHGGGAPHGPGAAGHDHGESSAAGTAGAGTPGTAAGAGHGHDESGGPAPAPGRVHVHADGRQHEHGAPRAASGVPRR